MLLFIFKIYRTLRRAIAGRRYPSQLAWAIALGLMLGFVPHGNLVALTLLLVILCLNINHAAMGLTALGASFFAWRLDPYSHQVGQFVLQKQSVADFATRAWQWPLVPWTDLNNSIVMGSLLIGLASLLPVFMVLYPLCRMMVPKTQKDPAEQDVASAKDNADVSLSPASARTMQAPATSPRPTMAPSASHSGLSSTSVEDVVQHLAKAIQAAQAAQPTSTSGSSSRSIDFVEVDPVDPRHSTTHTVHAGHAKSSPASPSVRTRMDVIRIQPDTQNAEPNRNKGPINDPAAMDEALNYLLRQLRESNQGDAA
jgi:uncharacterized protein (TIGR03546 family)